MVSRVVHLRRPPVLHADDVPFVASALALDPVERHWNELQQANSAYFDGQLWHVLGVHRNGHGGAAVHVQPCAYRFWAVQQAVGCDLGVRPLGVKGIVTRHERVLIGRRAAHVAVYPHLWEFAPGGVVEPGMTPANCVAQELMEETGLRCAQDPPAVAIVFDDVARSWEVVHRIDEPIGDVADTHEYPEARWVHADELADMQAELTPIARTMMPLVVAACTG